ncbi:uncharacterized protein JCM15063_004384 [Sporobolomyces koalae]|uniref:uncharacterized protein n=1 Tax=Sporobolomyces koalae TaxID=500713 RepID=UPI00316D1831
MVAIRSFLSAFSLIAAASISTAQLVDADLDLGLLQNGALVTADLFADALTQQSCPDGNIGVVVNLLNLVKVCGCVSLLNLGLGQSVCPTCPANSTPVCGRGNCACQCDEGFVSDTTTGSCVAADACSSSGGTLTFNGVGQYTCTCASPLVLGSSGVCVLAPSQGARARRRNLVFNSPAGPYSSSGRSSKYCPNNETACPLGNSFECIDTRDSLTHCGGCAASGGVDCLSIPGALNVQCANSKCVVSSCFSGYTLEQGRCI